MPSWNDLLDELDLEDDVFVDGLPVCVLTLPELGIEVEIDRPVILRLTLRQDLIPLEVVKRGQDVL